MKPIEMITAVVEGIHPQRVVEGTLQEDGWSRPTAQQVSQFKQQVSMQGLRQPSSDDGVADAKHLANDLRTKVKPAHMLHKHAAGTWVKGSSPTQWKPGKVPSGKYAGGTLHKVDLQKGTSAKGLVSKGDRVIGVYHAITDPMTAYVLTVPRKKK